MHPFGTKVRSHRQQMERIDRIPLEDSVLDRLLDSVYDKLSQRLAGGQRTNVNDLLPGAQDPLEGLVPEDMLPDLPMQDWFDPTVFARSTDQAEFDMTGISAASGPGKDGTGSDWFRTGEAPNNYVNRHNPLYKARTDFARQINRHIEELFGVSGGGVGYYRPPHANDSAPGGRSGNSDHYSAGAIDYYGTGEQLDRLRDWLTQQPFTGFVRWRSESHYDHLHVSFDLGWVAENYFQGRALPPITASASPQNAAVSAPTLPDSPDTSLGAENVAPELVRGRPS
jgi:hypothetical protein